MFSRRLGADSGLIGAFWRTESGELRPRRTGDNGQWSGVRYKTDFHQFCSLNLFKSLLQDVCINNDTGTGRPRSGRKTIDTGKL